jgi:nucleotide-binding universal stress UspA family protein
MVSSERGKELLMRILVGIDGSSAADRALAWALGEARAHDATLVAVHTWQPPLVYDGGFAPTPVPAPDEAYGDAAKAVLDDALARIVGPEPGVIVESQVVEGAAGEALVTLAADCDLIVVGSRGHGNLLGMLLGSVSQHCAHHARCPVVIVPVADRAG